MTRIGVVSTFTSGVFLSNVFSQLIRRAPLHGATLVILRTGDHLPDWESDLGMDLCDGWIILGDTPTGAFRQKLRGASKPVCYLAHDAADPTSSSVQSDNAAGVDGALSSLYELGHREFVFVGCLASQDILERAEAFRFFLDRHGLPNEPFRVRNSRDYSVVGGLEATRELHTEGVPFTALVAGNDQNAVGALRFFQQVPSGRSAPPAIFGYDNSSLAQDAAHRISSVDQDFASLCDAALTEVCRLVDHPGEPRSIRVSPRLALRQSTHPGAAPDAALDTGRAPQTNLLFRDEMNRVLHGKTSIQSLDSLLNRLGELGRTVLFAQVHGSEFEVSFSVGVPSDTLHPTGSIRAFGRELVELSEALAQTVFLIPIFSASQMVSLLGLAVPSAALSDHDRYSEALQELNLTNFTVELAVMRSHLEGIVEQRTRELRAAQDELVRTTQVAVLGPIVHGISHHLSTPLGNALLAITALADSLSKSPVDTETTGPLVDLISRNLDRMTSLVRQFQTVTDIQLQETPSAFAPDGVVQQAIEYIQAVFPRITFTFTPSSRSIDLWGPPRAFSASVEALLENAVIHGCAGRDVGEVLISTRLVADAFELRVTDSGPGMDVAEAAKVFAPFYTSDFAKSNGLGLTLVQNIVTARLRGTVSIETSPGNGFTVVCTIPLGQPRDRLY